MPTDDEKPGDIPEEPETQPDLFLFPCPGCTNDKGVPQGHVLVTKLTAAGTETRPERCPTCLGSRRVNREERARWRADRDRGRR